MELRDNEHHLEIIDSNNNCSMTSLLDAKYLWPFIVFSWGGDTCISVCTLERWIMISECIFRITCVERRAYLFWISKKWIVEDNLLGLPIQLTTLLWKLSPTSHRSRYQQLYFCYLNTNLLANILWNWGRHKMRKSDSFSRRFELRGTEIHKESC